VVEHHLHAAVSPTGVSGEPDKLANLLGVSTSDLRLLVRQRKLPKPDPINARCVGWQESMVNYLDRSCPELVGNRYPALTVFSPR
jgi:predicted DNA-binding transcriptional regulator AlpA